MGLFTHAIAKIVQFTSLDRLSASLKCASRCECVKKNSFCSLRYGIPVWYHRQRSSKIVFSIKVLSTEFSSGLFSLLGHNFRPILVVVKLVVSMSALQLVPEGCHNSLKRVPNNNQRCFGGRVHNLGKFYIVGAPY